MALDPEALTEGLAGVDAFDCDRLRQALTQARQHEQRLTGAYRHRLAWVDAVQARAYIDFQAAGHRAHHVGDDAQRRLCRCRAIRDAIGLPRALLTQTREQIQVRLGADAHAVQTQRRGHAAQTLTQGRQVQLAHGWLRITDVQHRA